MRVLTLLTIIVSFYFLKDVADCSDHFRRPQPFQDSFLPSVPLTDSLNWKNLGKIIQFSNTLKQKEVETKFSIYTRTGSIRDIKYEPMKDHIHHGQVVYQFNLKKLVKSGFDPKRRTIIMVPGFLTNSRPDWILEAKDLWLKMEDVNVIMVTWKDGNRTLYHKAVANTPVVARQITMLIYYLAELHGTSIRDLEFLNRIELTGHSLGSHISGFVGKDFNGLLGRITGLDPAGPFFHRMSRTKRLDRFDAKLVTILHSNRGWMDYKKLVSDGIKLFKQYYHRIHKSTSRHEGKNNNLGNVIEQDVPTHFGIDQQLGDVDYYINNGAEQAGCDGIFHTCDHGRSTEVYNSILKYELSTRSEQLQNSNLLAGQQNRLLAFQSNDYGEFASGFNLNSEKCSSSNESGRPNCIVPIDLVSPACLVRDELEKDFGLDFDKSNNQNPNSKYWFKTLPTKPFVGKHYMLRVEFDKQLSSWDSSCGLISSITMENGYILSPEVSENTRLIDNGDGFYGLMMPFINPTGSDRDDKALVSTTLNFSGSPQPSDKLSTELIPSKIELTIKRGTKREDKLLESASQSCNVIVKSLRVKPIVVDSNNQQSIVSHFFKSSQEKVLRKGKQLLMPNVNNDFQFVNSQNLNSLSVENSPTLLFDVKRVYFN